MQHHIKNRLLSASFFDGSYFFLLSLTMCTHVRTGVRLATRLGEAPNKARFNLGGGGGPPIKHYLTWEGP